MSGGTEPLASISLRDGTWLQISVDGVRNQNRVIELAKIQDARQVSPNPETIAFRVAGTGLLEFEPEHAGDGAIALEALFQLRPDLRPVGFGVPAASFPSGYPGYPVLPSYGTGGMTPMSPSGFPSGSAEPYAFPPSPGMGYTESETMAKRRAGGLVTPVPRGFGETVAAITQLYSSRIRVWLLLGLCIAPITGILDGGASYLFFSRILQGNQSSSLPSPTSCVLPTTYRFEAVSSLTRDGITLGILLFLSLLATTFQTAAMGIAAREVVFDRPVSVKKSLRDGLRRWRPTLGASFLTGAAYYLVLLPAVASYVVLFVTAGGTNLCATSSSTNAVVGLGCLGSVFLVVGLVLLALLAVRLGFAPYIAATSNAGVRQAIARSWQISQGHFWRAFGIILLTGTPVWLVLQVVSAFPPIVMVFVLTPITYLFSLPLITLTYITLLYDLQLRHEGYAAVAQEQQALQPSTPPSSVPPLG